MGLLLKAALSALLGGLARAAVYLYDRCWGDAAKYRKVREEQARHEGQLAAERARLEATTEAIAQEPDKTGTDLEDDVNRTFGG